MNTWTRSSRCVGGDCVEVAVKPHEVLIRDSKDPDGPVLRFTQDEWQAFLASARAGEFGNLYMSRVPPSDGAARVRVCRDRPPTGDCRRVPGLPTEGLPDQRCEKRLRATLSPVDAD